MNLSQIKERENNCYMPVFSRENICIVSGKGNVLTDSTGKKYVDFVAGIATNILGYGNKHLTAAIANQAKKLMHVSNHYYTEEQSAYIDALTRASGFERVFLCNSGAEANECAVKLIRRHFKNKDSKKQVILTSEGCFHGRTLATLTMTANKAQHEIYSPLPEGFREFKYNDIESFNAAMTDDVAAVMIETVQGEQGVRPFSNEFILNAYAQCKSKGALFALDEVQTGFGRTGKLFSFEHFGIVPDIITLAKGIAGGVPMGACLAHGEVATAFKLGDHGSTFGGNALACAAASCVLDELLNRGLLAKSQKTGEYFGNKLEKFASHPLVKDVRGLGLMRGIQFVPEVNIAQIEGMLASRGFLVNCAGNNTIRLIPPLTITEEEIDALTNALTLTLETLYNKK